MIIEIGLRVAIFATVIDARIAIVKHRVLLVEDDEPLAMMVRDFLIEQNFDVTIEANGLAANWTTTFERRPLIFNGPALMPKSMLRHASKTQTRKEI